ncbi:MAG: hypothetical protein AAFZ52_03840 [Bacteroidota bacterium]
MQQLLIAVLLLLLSSPVCAQTTPGKLPVSIAYLGHFGYQPGAKIGTNFNLLFLEGNRNPQRIRRLYLSPQLGLFTWPERHTSYLANLDFGLKNRHPKKNKYTAYSCGLGYLHQARITGWRVNLADGNREKIRENQPWFLWTLNFEFGKKLTKRIEWYTKISGGLRSAKVRATSTVAFLEIGIVYQ